MGDRATVVIVPHQPAGCTDLATICVYSHFAGRDIPQRVAEGLYAGRPRHGESSYMTRILIEAIIAGDQAIDGFGIGLTPFGIPADAGRPMLVVDLRKHAAGYLPWQRWPLTDPYALEYDFEAFIQVGAQWPQNGSSSSASAS